MNVQRKLSFGKLGAGYLASKLSLSQSHWSNICAGRSKLPIERIKPLAKLLGVSTDTVIDAFVWAQKTGEERLDGRTSEGQATLRRRRVYSGNREEVRPSR